MLRKFIIFIILLLVWIVFSGIFEKFLLTVAVLSAILSILVAQRMGILDSKNNIPTYLKPKVILYFFWLAKEIIKSGLDVSAKIWQAVPEIMPVLAWTKANQRTEGGLASYANSITLTPGTVCLNVEDGMIEVHALSQDGMDSLNDGVMDKKVAEFS